MHGLPPPTWFVTKINHGLQSLLPLALDNQPASELMGAAVQTWAEDLWSGRAWDQARDVPRIEEAWRRVRSDCSRWPTMPQFLDRLPANKAEPFQAQRLEWNRPPKNQSPTAKAHAAWCAKRLGLPVPDWTQPTDEDREQVERITADIVAKHGKAA